jgi:hypothetical protein
MFGGAVLRPAPDPELAREGAAAFQALVDALVSLQASGAVRRDDPLLLAEFIWAIVHGIAMLAIDARLPPQQDVEALTQFALARIRTGIAP